MECPAGLDEATPRSGGGVHPFFSRVCASLPLRDGGGQPFPPWWSRCSSGFSGGSCNHKVSLSLSRVFLEARRANVKCQLLGKNWRSNGQSACSCHWATSPDNCLPVWWFAAGYGTTAQLWLPPTTIPVSTPPHRLCLVNVQSPLVTARLCGWPFILQESWV